MRSREFDIILDECLARTFAGESLDECLRDYPEQAAELRPLLVLAEEVAALPHPAASPQAVLNGRTQMLRAAARRGPQTVSGSLFARYNNQVRQIFAWGIVTNTKPALRAALAVLLVCLLGSQVALVASAASLPGDALYPVKTGWEEVRLSLTPAGAARQQLEAQLAAWRRWEMAKMAGQGRQGMVKVTGPLEARADGGWSVAGIPVQMTDETLIDGDLALGTEVRAWVEVQQGGSVETVRLAAVNPSGRPENPGKRPENTKTVTRVPANAGGIRPTEEQGPTEELEPTDEPEPTRTPEPQVAPQQTPEVPSATPERLKKTPAAPPRPKHPPEKPEATVRPTHTPEPPGKPAGPKHIPRTPQGQAGEPKTPPGKPEGKLKTQKPTDAAPPGMVLPGQAPDKAPNEPGQSSKAPKEPEKTPKELEKAPKEPGKTPKARGKT